MRRQYCNYILLLVSINIYCSSCYGSNSIAVVTDIVVEGCREAVVAVGSKEVPALMLLSSVAIVTVDVVEVLRS